MTSLFTIRNTTSLPGLQIAAHIDVLEQRATILRTAKNLARSEKVKVRSLMVQLITARTVVRGI